MTPEERAVIGAAIEWYERQPHISNERDEFDAVPLTCAVEALIESRKPAEEWTPATLLYCLANDRIRIGTDETKVLRSSSGLWYVNTENYWHPTPWRHTELRLELEANPGFQEYPPSLECEILMSPERLAVFALQQAFPGTAVISDGRTG